MWVCCLLSITRSECGVLGLHALLFIAIIPISKECLISRDKVVRKNTSLLDQLLRRTPPSSVYTSQGLQSRLRQFPQPTCGSRCSHRCVCAFRKAQVFQARTRGVLMLFFSFRSIHAFIAFDLSDASSSFKIPKQRIWAAFHLI
jgi:hypothetical protein